MQTKLHQTSNMHNFFWIEIKCLVTRPFIIFSDNLKIRVLCKKVGYLSNRFMPILSGTLLKNCMSKLHIDLTRSVQGCSLVILNCCRLPALTVRDHVEPLASFCRRYGECACANNFTFTLRLSTTLSTIWFLVLVVRCCFPLPTLAL